MYIDINSVFITYNNITKLLCWMGNRKFSIEEVVKLCMGGRYKLWMGGRYQYLHDCMNNGCNTVITRDLVPLDRGQVVPVNALKWFLYLRY